MPRVELPGQPLPLRRPQLWRVAVWALLLVSAFGALQYIKHMQNVWSQISENSASLQPDQLDALHGMLGWDAAYLLVVFLLIVICAGCILRQGWARPCLRVAAVALAVWLLVTAYLQWHDLQALAANGAAILAEAQQRGASGAAAMLARLQRQYQLALVFKSVGVVVLLWLAWRLGRASVRAQFRTCR